MKNYNTFSTLFPRLVNTKGKIGIFNTSGQLMRTASMQSGQERLQIELLDLPKGIYIVRVEHEASAGVRKLFIQ